MKLIGRRSRLVKGEWGDPRSLRQKGIVTYSISGNRVNPLAGTFKAAIFDIFRRTRGQILYWGLPMFVAYRAMEWAVERNEYTYSKAGRVEYGEE
ncbi:hypothetical protein CERZMDRAFT_52938 [Cercospora zeae-maydis SCOH1-5]|uniref:Cytochrome b-c1 complex subunit 8 n=1 Tax=Cercospora zeae-maydis SCOH1-5 TaxID=717836 RepID=A0A6A6EYP1_9PEZI|nr:hypothetical protein CERZMDRAFT_52938 [Cercospora zeae-maydis SCOH1-5]